ncbi:phage tail protein [Cupriavidus nantongensis]|uniref:Phage tail protein n=1 Tax=Cupriavidus nantongensis TaxID=1796606 RepID=A0A142JGU5_9BURK|nr:phage tail protein [Cupriavidus nantongensis]AMR77307.1 phage tail protein [Cupriavidus nantongensis]
MLKPNSLRAHLTGANPDLQANPDKLSVFIDQGRLVSTGTASLSCEYRYTVNLVLQDYAGTADAVMLPILAWVKVHQADLLANQQSREKGIRFLVDVLANDRCDLSIEIDLTERVIVKPGTGANANRLEVKHAAEPQLAAPYADEATWALYSGDNLLAEWQVPKVLG